MATQRVYLTAPQEKASCTWMSCHNQHLLEPLHFDRFGWYISTCHQRPLPIRATKIKLKKYFADFERHNFVDLLVFSCSSCGEAKWSCKRVKRAPSTNRTHHGFFPRSWIQQSDSNNKVRANSTCPTCKHEVPYPAASAFLRTCCIWLHVFIADLGRTPVSHLNAKLIILTLEMEQHTFHEPQFSSILYVSHVTHLKTVL